MPVKVAVCQVPDIRENIIASLEWIKKFTQQAAAKKVALICFPECFLQGYLTVEKKARKYAVDLSSGLFKEILEQLTVYKPVIVFGLIEQEEKDLFNTAVVIREGVLLGKYRKINLLWGENIFTAGNQYPVFEAAGLRFGINICYDTQFPAAAAALAVQGVQLILCPANNMMKYIVARKYKYLHHAMRKERVRENGVWLLSADVTGERDGRIGYGPTSAIDPTGNIVAQVPLMETGILVVEIQETAANNS